MSTGQGSEESPSGDNPIMPRDRDRPPPRRCDANPPPRGSGPQQVGSSSRSGPVEQAYAYVFIFLIGTL